MSSAEDSTVEISNGLDFSLIKLKICRKPVVSA